MSRISMDDPEVMAICEACSVASCGGDCARFRKEYADICRRRRAENPKPETKRYTVNGFTGTIAQWAERLGVRENTLRKRLSEGWSEEKVFSNRFHEIEKCRKYVYKGKVYALSALAKAAGIPVRLLRSRLAKGQTLEEAIANGFCADRRAGTRLYEYRGQKYTIGELADMRGVSYECMRWRLLKMDIETAVNGTKYQRRGKDDDEKAIHTPAAIAGRVPG